MAAVERKFSSDVRLISTTDLKGIITYSNKEFCDIAGFTEEELIGKPHSIVRHPDMPKAAFADLWNHAKNDKPWIGLVKNRTKDGNYYWVQAYVTPIFDLHGQKVGYQSVRTSPTDAEIRRAEQVYAKINAGKLTPPTKKTSLAPKVLAVSTVAVAVFWLLAFLELTPMMRGSMLAGWSVLLGIAGWKLFSSIDDINTESSSTCNHPLAQFVLSERMDEVGGVKLSLKVMRARLRTLLGRVEDSVNTLSGVVDKTNTALTQTSEGIDKQMLETDSLASAATQMSATSHEVAANTVETSNVAQQATSHANHGKSVVSEMSSTITELVNEVGEASEASLQLKAETESIGDIVTMISDIADQTNLLALNAAIEAARAGEQGRGFAVVADEVRTLAQRTQTSTSEIREKITSIQSHVQQTVTAMESSRGRAQDSVERAGSVESAFDEVVSSMQEISDRSVQMASAAEQQSSVSDEISKNITSLRNIAEQNQGAASHTNHAVADLDALIVDLKSSIKSLSI